MLSHFNQMADILYYEILDIPLPELQGLKTLRVAFHHATNNEVELSCSDTELWLFEVYHHRICKVPEEEENAGTRDRLVHVYHFIKDNQEIIQKYINTSGKGNKHAALASTSGELTWEKPVYSDFQVLSRESEYAAWTLVNGYALNHATIATHRLELDIRSISKFNKFMEDNGFKLNSEGGILKGCSCWRSLPTGSSHHVQKGSSCRISTISL